MLESIHKVLLAIHVPFGFLSLVLFWIPISMKKGSPNHRKVGWYYYVCMWVVTITAALLSINNLVRGRMEAAMFLGFLALITAYPLWYSYEILQQKKEWSNRYFVARKIFVWVISLTGLAMFLFGAMVFKFQDMGFMMAFFGVIAMASFRDVFMSKPKAMENEKRMDMHIKGTIISGIAAYTAFSAFGGSRIFIDMLYLPYSFMIIAWTAPSVFGVAYMWYMRQKYRTI